MERRNLILSLFAIGCFIATATLIPGLGTAQDDVEVFDPVAVQLEADENFHTVMHALRDVGPES